MEVRHALQHLHRATWLVRSAGVLAQRSFGAKSSTCYGATSGQPLMEYHSHEAATEGAAHVNARSGGRWLEPYQCPSCGMWHLGQQHRRTPSIPCACLSRNGRPKALFFTRRDAERRSDLIWSEKGTHLSVYKCELGLGWHLTRG